jgi:hypothetical protein
MNEEREHFESLRNLLALKRHEIPPPGYFDRLSRDVLARLRTGETQTAARLKGNWLARLLDNLQAKPSFAVGFAAVVCSILALGIIFADQSESAPQPFLQSAQESPATLSGPATFARASGQPLSAFSSTTPVLSAQTSTSSPSLFDQISRLSLNTQPVDASYSTDNQ